MHRLLLSLVLGQLTLLGSGQVLTGRLVGDQLKGTQQLFLLVSRGADHRFVTAAKVEADGRFTFKERSFPRGFYQLALNDSDRVDIILDPREPQVDITLSGSPLQEHIVVNTSAENTRLWRYKQASRRAQEELTAINDQRVKASPYDHVVLRRLDSTSAAAVERKQRELAALVAEDPDSYFRSVVKADARLMSALHSGIGPQAIRDSVDWTDAALARSNIYPKGIMAILQSATPATVDQLIAASDSVLAWSAPEPYCWELAREILVELFVQYGPADVVQYLVDRYVMGPGSRVPPDETLLAMVAEQLKVAIGAPAPDVSLPRPGERDTVQLSAVWARNQYTVLFFYSSTCDHCHAQMPGLSDMHRDLRSKGVAVLGVALDHDRAEFEANIRERALSFPCYTELQAWGSPAAKAFAIKATPSFVVVDRTGRIVAKPYDHEELRAFLIARLH